VLTGVRSARPSTGSAPNITPPTRALSMGCTSTAIGAVDPSGRCAESSTEANCPAGDDCSVSSCGEEDRTTRGSAPESERSCQARRRVAGAARARFAALEPANRGSVAVS